MKQKRNKPRYNAQFKTFHSEQSCIDVFSKVQSIFLEKFFRYNLSDYFHDLLSNVEQELFLKKLKHKQIKQLASECFLAKTDILLPDFQHRLNSFYSSKSDQIQGMEMPFSFRLLHSNCQEGTIWKDQLVMVQVRMRAEIQKIENLPNYFYRELEMCQNQQGNSPQKDQQEVLKQLKKYDKGVINLLVVYFGDINFHLFDHSQYTPVTVQFFNREVKVRIYVFYISRLGLLASFKKINKIQNLQYINDLLIQLYQFKREKARNKRLKGSRMRNQQVSPKNERLKSIYWYLKWFGIISVGIFGIGALILKFLF